jgi:uncharacterized protein YndB with AHSA1/START domain
MNDSKTTLTLTRRIAARPTVVWEALTTPEGLSAWIGPDDGPVVVAEADPVVGGRFRVRFRMLDESEHEGRGEYVVVDPPRRLVMTWDWEGDEDEGISRVEITLRPVDGGTELTFVHAGLSDEVTRDGHARGWRGSLDKLDRHVTGRTDGAVDRVATRID